MRSRSRNYESKLRKNSQKRHFKLIQCPDDVDLALQKKFCREVITLCRPLSNLFNVSYFSHTRAFHNGQFVSLMTNPELTENFLKRQYPISFSNGKGFYLNSGYYLSDSFTQNFGVEGEKLKIFWDEFRIGHMISIIKKHDCYDDMYSFGINTEDKALVSKFLNHLKMIEHFILFFKNQTLDIMNKIEFVSYSKDYFPLNPNKPDMTHITGEEQKAFFQALPLKKIQVAGNLGDVLLSQREYECLGYANKCYSLKEIAKCMSISPRTVETYMNNVKIKLGVERRSDLAMFDL